MHKMRYRQNVHPSSMWRALPVLSKFHTVLMMVICASGLLTACGPGTVGTQTRKNKAPMQLRQSLPRDVPETSLAASGQYIARVRRGSEAYKALELNFNPDIVFKVDEKSDSDERRMTKNCFKKLNKLAEDVKRTWGSKGVKLRVINAFDLDDVKKRHGEKSLHHEGRAVDLTTSDRDKSKYPILGRMAYTAGFNYVFYASKSYIHASVKTDEDAEEEPVSCFPETASVRLEGGQTKTMKDLQIGDKVASMDSSGRIVYSKVLTFLDIKRNMSTAFVTIETKNPAARVTITEFHLIYQLNKHALQESVVFARDLKVGDFLYVRKNESSFDRFTAGRIVAIKRRQSKGAYAPLTETGNIVVNGVLCSCYAVISDPRIAHWSFAPLRLAEWLSPGIASHNKAGMHWYAQVLYKLYTSWNFVYEKVFDNS